MRRDQYPSGPSFELLGAQLIDPTTQGGKSNKESEDVLTLTVRARLQRVGREMRMLVENTDDQTTADPGLLRIVARAHEIQERLMQNTDLTVHVIASQEQVSANYVYRLLRLPTLAPDIITAIVNGKNPPQLTAKKLMRLTPQIPVDWAEQRKLLGFQRTISHRFGWPTTSLGRLPQLRDFGAPSPSTKSEPLKAARETFWSATARIWRKIVSAV